MQSLQRKRLEKEVVARLYAAGLDEELMVRIAHAKDNALARSIIEHAAGGTGKPVANQRLARDIMKSHFLGTDEVMRYFGVKYHNKELLKLATIPWSAATLRECRYTHVLVAGYPLAITRIRACMPDAFQARDGEAWYDQHDFANTATVGLRWYLVRTGIVLNSLGESFRDQERLLTPADELPRACEVAYAAALYFRANGERLFSENYVRCRDEFSEDEQIIIGQFTVDGMCATHCGREAMSFAGITSSRRPEFN